MKAFYGKWTEALFSIDVNVWDEYIKVSASSSSLTPSESSGKLNSAVSTKVRLLCVSFMRVSRLCYK
jgi:hypothetical protein